MNKTDILLESAIRELEEMAFGRGQNARPTTYSTLIDMVRQSENKGARPFSFTSITDARLKKTGNPYKKVWKVSQVNSIINADYEASVNRQRGREELDQDFKRQDNWGQHETPSIIESKGTYYIQVHPQTTRSPIFVAQTNDDSLELVTKEQIQPWMPPSKPNINQGVSKEIVLRRYTLNNIVGFALDKQEYYITDANELQQAILDVANPAG